MRLLLDTHSFIWWLTRPSELTPKTDRAIRDPDHEVFVSAVTTWEISIKSALGKLPRVPMDQLEKQIVLSKFTPLPVQIAHTLAVHKLPPIHKDPFDRLLVAQAKLENLTLVTRDLRLKEYGLPVLET